MKRALYSKLEILLVSDDVIRWRCGQLLSPDFIVYETQCQSFILWLDFGYRLWKISELWAIVSL